MADRRKEFTQQIVVRVDPKLHQALKQDAQSNGRTVAQSIRFVLGQSLIPQH